MNTAAAYGILAHGLIFGALAAMLPFDHYRPRVALAATTVALIGGIAPAMHGAFGTPSLTLLQLAILQLSNQTPSPLGFRPAAGLLVFASVFYPLALGLGPFDPYALGYQPWALLAALIPVALALWWRRLNLWLLILAIDMSGYAFGIFANLWDALLDPLLVILALSVVARQGIVQLIARRRRAPATPLQG